LVKLPQFFASVAKMPQIATIAHPRGLRSLDGAGLNGGDPYVRGEAAVFFRIPFVQTLPAQPGRG